jgi:hypothetical protein
MARLGGPPYRRTTRYDAPELGTYQLACSPPLVDLALRFTRLRHRTRQPRPPAAAGDSSDGARAGAAQFGRVVGPNRSATTSPNSFRAGPDQKRTIEPFGGSLPLEASTPVPNSLFERGVKRCGGGCPFPCRAIADLRCCSGNHLREPPCKLSQAPRDISGHDFRRSSA